MREMKFGMIQSPLQVDLDRIADEVVDCLDVDCALINVSNNSALLSLGLSRSVQSTRDNTAVLPDDVLCWKVKKINAPLALSDARDHPDFRESHHVKSGLISGYIGVPIQNAEIGGIGVVCGITSLPRAWTEADLRYMQAVSSNLENLILREMYRIESLDASTLASEYDQIIAAFALVRAEATSIHDPTGRLVFANRDLTEKVDERELETTRFKSVLLKAAEGEPIRYRSEAGTCYVLTRLRTSSGYLVCQWTSNTARLN